MKKLIIIALIVSIVTGYAVYQYATNLEKTLSVKTEPVVVATVKIPKNTLIKPEMTTVKEIPSQAVNALAVRNQDEVIGRIAKEDLEPNEQIFSTRLSHSEDKNQSLSYVIKEGHRALTVKTDEATGVSGRISKGDYVDIIAILPDSASPTGVKSAMVAENIEVLETGIKSSGDSSDGGQYTSITISVPAEDVLRINYALSEGKYSIALHSVLDKNVVNPPPYTP